jgi:membrane associated rhomboid family serine protease
MVFVFVMWFVYWFEISFGYNFNKWGVYPLTLSGLKGIVFSPFIHGDSKHLFNNTIPMIVLLAALLFFYKPIANKVLIIGWLGSGMLTWLVARSSYHIGASGLIYMLVSFIFFSGILRKHFRLIALSLAVIFLYGSLAWYLFPIVENMSFEGHASGFVMGLILAFVFRKKGPQQEEKVWEQTEFDEFFDEQGNLKSD